MKEIAKDCIAPVFQGDVLIVRIPASQVPKNAQALKTNVIAHSETGHHHIAKYADVLGGLDPMVMFLKPTGEKDHVDIVHLRDFDTHEPYRLYYDEGDAFIIKRQREYTPQGFRRVED